MTNQPDNCVFCNIIEEKEPAIFHYKEPNFVVFENNLGWLDTQLLIVPSQHLTQTQLWNNGNLLSSMGNMANNIGKRKCPNGYRILSNFGKDGMQSQSHAHMHLLGGRNLGMYIDFIKDTNA
jgi:histidine triad (HIT) family protein